MDKLIKESKYFQDPKVFGFSQTSINQVWEFFVQSVMCAANKHIPKTTTTLHHKSLYNFDNSVIHKQIKKLYKLYHKTKVFLDKISSEPTPPFSPFNISLEEHKSVLTIALEHKISSASLDSFFYQKNLFSYFNDLKASIIKQLKCKLKIFSK